MYAVYNKYGEIIKIIGYETYNSIYIPEHLEKEILREQKKYRVINNTFVLSNSLDYLLWYYEKKLDEYIDSVAQQKGYDNRITCTMRAGVEGSPYQEECKRFAIWQDECYVKAYEIMNAVLSGKRKAPSVEELIQELPKFSWGE